MDTLVGGIPPIIEADSISKVYHSEGQDVVALEPMSLCARTGEVVWLHGESGSGKTTLLNIIGLLVPPDSGTLSLGGEEVRWGSMNAIAHRRKESIGFVFQSHNLIGWLGPLDNALLAADRSKKVRATGLLTDLGLGQRLNLPANKLSGGEQQRAAIARAIINHPPIVLADEPISGLDDAVARRVLEGLSSIASDGACVIIASHQALVGQYCSREVSMQPARQTARRGKIS